MNYLAEGDYKKFNNRSIFNLLLFQVCTFLTVRGQVLLAEFWQSSPFYFEGWSTTNFEGTDIVTTCQNEDILGGIDLFETDTLTHAEYVPEVHIAIKLTFTFVLITSSENVSPSNTLTIILNDIHTYTQTWTGNDPGEQGNTCGYATGWRENFYTIEYQYAHTDTVEPLIIELSVETCGNEKCFWGIRNMSIYYFDGICDSSCLTCFGPQSSSMCQTCADGYYLSPANNAYPEGNQYCLLCDVECATCSLAPNNCLTCADYSSRQTTPDCACKYDYVEVGFTACEECASQCVNCTTNATNCGACQGANSFNSTPACSCITNYYRPLGESDCIICEDYCNECEGSATSCIACAPGYFRSNPPNCFCSTGYYDNGVNSTCEACPSNCDVCTSSTNCMSCSHSPTVYYLIPSNRSCTTNCPSTYFANISTYLCESCSSNCLECSLNTNNCTNCVNGTFLYNGVCFASCPLGSFESGNQCNSCSPSCLTCSASTATACLSCTYNYFILPPSSGRCGTCESIVGLYTPNYITEASYSSCRDICGDAKRVGSDIECDDGNNVDGDGCSANCMIESGWTCSGGSPTTADTCTDNRPLALFITTSDQNTIFNNFYENFPYNFELSFSQNVIFPDNEIIDNFIQIYIVDTTNASVPFTVSAGEESNLRELLRDRRELQIGLKAAVTYEVNVYLNETVYEKKLAFNVINQSLLTGSANGKELEVNFNKIN